MDNTSVLDPQVARGCGMTLLYTASLASKGNKIAPSPKTARQMWIATLHRWGCPKGGFGV